MSQEEIVMKQEAGVKSYHYRAPTLGIHAFDYKVGSIILTNKRLVFISKGKKARLGLTLIHPIAAMALEKKISKAELDDLLAHKGSYSIPLNEITRVQVARKWTGTAFLRVDHVDSGEGSVHSYIFGNGYDVDSSLVETLKSSIGSKN